MLRTWSTSDVPPRDRRAFWVDAICGALVRVDCEPRHQGDFFGELNCDACGEIQVVSVRSMPQGVIHSARQIARDPVEYFQLNVQARGRGLVAQDGRRSPLRAGDFALTDSTRPFRLSFDCDVWQTVLQIPAQSLLCRIGASERVTAVRVDASGGIGALLSPLLRQLPSQLETIPASTRERIAGNLLDLIAIALLSATGAEAPLSSAMTLTRVKFWIETHLAEELSAALIAGSCRLSIRHLNRLFAREGTSLMHYVWERRIARCHRDLLDPALRHRSISEVAFAAGFNDLSHFSRTYRARYGSSPRETRNGLTISD